MEKIKKLQKRKKSNKFPNKKIKSKKCFQFKFLINGEKLHIYN